MKLKGERSSMNMTPDEENLYSKAKTLLSSFLLKTLHTSQSSSPDAMVFNSSG